MFLQCFSPKNGGGMVGITSCLVDLVWGCCSCKFDSAEPREMKVERRAVSRWFDAMWVFGQDMAIDQNLSSSTTLSIIIHILGEDDDPFHIIYHAYQVITIDVHQGIPWVRCDQGESLSWKLWVALALVVVALMMSCCLRTNWYRLGGPTSPNSSEFFPKRSRWLQIQVQNYSANWIGERYVWMDGWAWFEHVWHQKRPDVLFCVLLLSHGWSHAYSTLVPWSLVQEELRCSSAQGHGFCIPCVSRWQLCHHVRLWHSWFQLL